MCGLAGEFVFTGSGKADAASAEAMAARLAHRGPDEAGSWVSGDGRCVLAARRLAVMDRELSHQPMSSPEGSATVAFNGEIYNFRELRAQLEREGATFRTRGDTEVLPEMWLRRGEAMLEGLRGMFAFAIHDGRRGELFCARDRLGQKPLWYAVLPDRLVLASEAKALLSHPKVPAEIDPAAVAFYLTLGYIPAPRSIWRGIRKLPPGHCMTAGPGGAAAPRRYWRPPQETAPVAPEAAAERVREAVTRAVEERLSADVPVGVLLSGGVDSSIVAAVACRAAGDARAVKTFTAGFAEVGFDERPFAGAVARHLGTDHRELPVRPSGAAALLDRLVGQYDEPFADSSALPTFLICRAAREHVTAALTGDGGDEAFAGYDRYRAMHLGQSMRPGKYLLTKLAAAVVGPFAPHDERSRLQRFLRFARAIDEVPAMQYFLYRRLFGPEQLRALMERDFAASAEVEAPREWFCELYEQGEFADEVAYAQQHDLHTYLPDDLLVKADIASMAASLELRAPLLDHDVVALGLSLPAEAKLRGGRGKAALRDAFADLLPPEVFDRPKSGFAAPLDHWLRADLAETLRRTLLDGPLVGRDWLRRPVLEGLIEEHLGRRADHRHRLWALLWLGRWLEAA